MANHTTAGAQNDAHLLSALAKAPSLPPIGSVPARQTDDGITIRSVALDITFERSAVYRGASLCFQCFYRIDSGGAGGRQKARNRRGQNQNERHDAEAQRI